jgi:hypothetical protein
MVPFVLFRRLSSLELLVERQRSSGFEGDEEVCSLRQSGLVSISSNRMPLDSGSHFNGVQRIHNPSRKLTEARDEMIMAHNRLDDFLLRDRRDETGASARQRRRLETRIGTCRRLQHRLAAAQVERLGQAPDEFALPAKLFTAT